MPKALEVKPLPNYRLWLRYDDETSGEVDVSHLAGKGVFKAWENQDFFQQVRIGAHGEIAWSDEIDLCSDSLYLKLTQKSPEEMFPSLKNGVNA